MPVRVWWTLERSPARQRITSGALRVRQRRLAHALLGCAFCPGCSPRDRKLLLSGRTISEIQVDQRLIPDSSLLRESLEVGVSR